MRKFLKQDNKTFPEYWIVGLEDVIIDVCEEYYVGSFLRI